jgi:hypothetical protein
LLAENWTCFVMSHHCLLYCLQNGEAAVAGGKVQLETEPRSADWHKQLQQHQQDHQSDIKWIQAQLQADL